MRQLPACFVVVALVAAVAPTTGRASPPPDAGVPPAPASTGGVAWRAARWGMTVEELVKAFPGEASRLEKPILLPDGNVVSAGFAEDHVLAGVRLVVRFVFDGSGHLALVSLRSPEKQYAGPEVYATLRKHLAEQLGGPGEETKDDNFVDMRQTRWSGRPTSVDLKYIPGTVVILYHPTPG